MISSPPPLLFCRMPCSWSASARSFLCQDLWHMLEACSVRSSSMSLQCRGPTAPAPALPPHEVLRKHLVLAFIQHAPTILMALVTSQHPTQAGQSRNFPTGRLTRLVEVCAAGDTRSRIPGTSQRGAEQLAVQGVVWALQTVSPVAEMFGKFVHFQQNAP